VGYADGEGCEMRRKGERYTAHSNRDSEQERKRDGERVVRHMLSQIDSMKKPQLDCVCLSYNECLVAVKENDCVTTAFVQ
jgi:hypothetical protein